MMGTLTITLMVFAITMLAETLLRTLFVHSLDLLDEADV